MTAASRWTELKIRNFRGLRRLDLTALGTFNLLFGANDVGKTSVLEAIFLLSGHGNIDLPIRVQNLRNFIVGNIDGLTPLLHGLDPEIQCTLGAIAADGSRRDLTISTPREVAIIPSEPEHLPTGPDSQSSSAVPAGRRTLRYDGLVRAPNNEGPISFSGVIAVKQDHLETSMEPASASEHTVPARFIPANSGYDASVISDVKIHKKIDVLVKYVNIIDPTVTDIAPSGNVVYADIGLRQMLPINMLGNGVVRAISILGPCILGDYRILLIDEIENGLHHQTIPELLKVLLKLSRERDIQVFATTHSRNILESFAEVLSRDDCAIYREESRSYALQRDQDDLIRPYSYDSSDIGYALTHDIEVR